MRLLLDVGFESLGEGYVPLLHDGIRERDFGFGVGVSVRWLLPFTLQLLSICLDRFKDLRSEVGQRVVDLGSD